ncbi:WD40/YVTN/BNR-like repeat-containing protein [Paucisalibacillus globulus]|uniref:WD40/YVTN/BNR-like repeat-containing protein n=1 Tax=Paucisalibacillus globulus TaxID=351095 RepID=UPI0003FEEE5F|nr:exo-alpha-sialidase [Paucisalibacillus globulus]
MKNYLLILSTLMIIGLIIGTYYYQNQDYYNTLPQLTQPNNLQEDTTNEPQVAPLQPVTNEKVSYSLQNDELNITYNKGIDWIQVPIQKDLLFNGEYQGNQQELIDGSYMLTEERAVFLYKQAGIMLKYSLDQGKTWKESVVAETFPTLRFRKVELLNDEFGYVIASGDRTMSSEYSTAFLTYDGGETWEATADPPTLRLIAYGGFVDEKTGFLSYGTINPEEPDVYVTQDGGDSWSKANFHHNKRFVQAEVPFKEEDHLAVLVNQGPNGDYKGGLVKGKFISTDNGLTWEFQEEVDPDGR